MPFLSTWFCEIGFSIFVEIKNTARKKITIKSDLWCALAKQQQTEKKFLLKCDTKHYIDIVLLSKI